MSRNRTALIEAIEARRLSRFRWRRGRDCVSFAAACVKAQTGSDPLAGLGSWANLREARERVSAEGGLEAALDARFDRVPPALAQRGDIAGVPDPLFGIRLMVIEGEMLVGPATRGLERLPRSEMTIAWSIDARGSADE
ncbi:DUF6950 family protein [Erythrobacter sp. WG]|uniref:DUF6950 family protein n=1 Tax=Erythrobacter sp. WG TaxID=2985510 RepID=UPI002270D9F5|nr:hypothetical protein [Erythrobacter sp. WG]MCX9146626.1 hypothetical protein [Erythrobacter sp. WG]